MRDYERDAFRDAVHELRVMEPSNRLFEMLEWWMEHQDEDLDVALSEDECAWLNRTCPDVRITIEPFLKVDHKHPVRTRLRIDGTRVGDALAWAVHWFMRYLSDFYNGDSTGGLVLICERCAKHFIASKENAKTCSRACRQGKYRGSSIA